MTTLPTVGAGAAPALGFAQGAGFLLRGARLWRTRPGLMLLGVVPALIVALLLAAVFVTLLFWVDDLVAWATPFADGWDAGVRTPLRFLLGLAVLAGAAMLAVVTFTGLTLAVGDPFYARIWAEVERSLGGEVPEAGVGWLRGARDGLVLVVLGALTGLCVFVVGLLPFVGAVLGAVLGLLVSGRLLAGELVSRPLEARGLDRRARAALMRRHRGAMLGFGISVQACFLVPLGGIAVMPAAVAGATYLAREALGSEPA
ncbi:EI24 domain-containing protein [Nocardioides sp. zg-536]|uniref:EI24 domain-containing protein n=1 Tax=Nocardioides faecalis TaxID=2803858 RepID=A0A938Y6X2_9ACTN|nr:EI24 domain-containing protein [Nocardioides faecalis]MBM9460385.1 EI24 domain-containing protein [Nocardioides faecalis]MBS4751310.1 EI24 domain-containing protein [Nocardioides faecalis]QVI59788.1 EI24 domain-containing protein [Nocardioides faecalis]